MLRDAIDTGGFLWLTGIDNTFITAPNPRTGRALDEYELTQHYARWHADLGLMAELGVRAARYGLPWHRVNPAPGRWDFAWADATIERLLELGIEPVLDLVHYGVPSWIEGAFLNPDYPARVEEYAAAVAERFRDRVHAFTPLNEPRITAWYGGKLGWWPPFRRGWSGFLDVLFAACRGIARTSRAIAASDPLATVLHVDAGDLYFAADEEARVEAERLEQIAFLPLDLLSGRVDATHPLCSWLLAQGVSEASLREFHEAPLALDAIGINAYPLLSLKVLSRLRGRSRVTTPYAGPEIIEQLAALYYTRYGRPLVLSETASDGSVERRAAWLESSVAAVARARACGVPIVGYTWWPLFARVAWAYRQGSRPIASYLKQMGLWDLSPGKRGLERVRTRLVERYRELAESGAAAVGPLGPDLTATRA